MRARSQRSVRRTRGDGRRGARGRHLGTRDLASSSLSRPSRSCSSPPQELLEQCKEVAERLRKAEDAESVTRGKATGRENTLMHEEQMLQAMLADAQVAGSEARAALEQGKLREEQLQGSLAKTEARAQSLVESAGEARATMAELRRNAEAEEEPGAGELTGSGSLQSRKIALRG